MKFKSPLILAILLFTSLITAAQSKTTEALAKKHSDALALFFYNNTLRMLNQTEDKAFDELIKDIEKMKFLMIKKQSDLDATGYKKLVSDYKAESFEEIMTSRHEGKSFDIFLKEKNSKTQGMLVLVNDTENLLVLDIVGSIAMNKITSLYDQMNKSTDLQKMLKSFTDDKDDDRHKDKDDDHGDDDKDKDDAKERKSKKN
jgi:hypothetical protein